MAAHPSLTRRRGSAAGWIIVVIVLVALAAFVAAKIIYDRVSSAPGPAQPTTQQD